MGCRTLPKFANRLEKGQGPAVILNSMHKELLYYVDEDEPEPPRAEAA